MIKQENKPFNDSFQHVDPLKEEKFKEKLKKKIKQCHDRLIRE